MDGRRSLASLDFRHRLQEFRFHHSHLKSAGKLDHEGFAAGIRAVEKLGIAVFTSRRQKGSRFDAAVAARKISRVELEIVERFLEFDETLR